MALDKRLKKLEEVLSSDKDDLIIVCREGEEITEQQRVEAIAKARATGQKVVLLGQLEEWSR